VRGDLLERTGLNAQAAEAFTEAAARSSNESERALLQRRAEDSLAFGSSSDDEPTWR
jgi:predicted RNA polymerase sigma factor